MAIPGCCQNYPVYPAVVIGLNVAVPARAAMVLKAVTTESVRAYLQSRVEGGAPALVG